MLKSVPSLWVVDHEMSYIVGWQVMVLKFFRVVTSVCGSKYLRLSVIQTQYYSGFWSIFVNASMANLVGTFVFLVGFPFRTFADGTSV